MYSNWIRKLNAENETIRLLEEGMGELPENKERLSNDD